MLSWGIEQRTEEWSKFVTRLQPALLFKKAVSCLSAAAYCLLLYGSGCHFSERPIASAASSAPSAVKATLSSMISCRVIM